MRRCFGREIHYSVPVLNRVGYAANREAIHRAFAAWGGDPAAFDRYAAEFHDDVDRRTALEAERRARRQR
jgi:hypothetical protein